MCSAQGRNAHFRYEFKACGHPAPRSRLRTFLAQELHRQAAAIELPAGERVQRVHGAHEYIIAVHHHGQLRTDAVSSRDVAPCRILSAKPFPLVLKIKQALMQRATVPVDGRAVAMAVAAAVG